MTEDDVVGSEQLRKIMRGEADAPLRQIKAEFVPHRPAQPRIDPRRRRPYAFHQPANNDPVGLRQPRFQRAINSQGGIRRLRPPHHAVAKRGLEHFRVVADLHHQAALPLSAEQIVERGGERQSVRALERQRNAMLVARQRDQHVAMALCQFGEIIRLRGRETFERRKRGMQGSNQQLRAIELPVSQSGPRLRSVQRRRLAHPEFRKLSAKAGEVARQSGASRLRAGAAQ